MADVKIAQIGQTAVNQPFFQITVNNVNYAFSTDEFDRIQFRNREWLTRMGINSLVAKSFANELDYSVKVIFKLDGNGLAKRDTRFSAITLGTGYGFVSDFNPRSGWKNLNPTNALMYQM